MKGGNGSFTADTTSASAWTDPMVASATPAAGFRPFFNRGNADVADRQPFRARRHQRRVTARVSQEPGNARLPGAALSLGDALQSILTFLHDADQRGSSIRAAIYEMNDQELIDALKPFGNRGHVLLGNGGSTRPTVAPALTAPSLTYIIATCRTRDARRRACTTSSCRMRRHRQERSRVLTGSTNWTTTGLCTAAQQCADRRQSENRRALPRPMEQARRRQGRHAARAEDVNSQSTPTATSRSTTRRATTKPSSSRCSI